MSSNANFCEWNAVDENNIDNGMEWKILQACCSGYREAIITQIEPVERGYYKACMALIRKKFHKLVIVLQSYDVN